MRPHARGDAPWVVWCLVAVATISVLALRAPDAFLHPQLWAEDAFVYYSHAAYRGWGSLLLPYAGYWQTFGRLVGVLGTYIPIRHIPALYATGALVGTIAAITTAVVALSPDRRVRIALALAVLTAPWSGEIWLSITNVQWPIGLCLVAIVAAPAPRTAAAAIPLACVALLAAISGPFGPVLLPLVFLRVWWWRDRWSALLLGILALSTLLVVGTVLVSERGHDILTARWQQGYRYALREWTMGCVLMVTASGMLALTAWMGMRRRDWALVACPTAGLLVLGATLASVGPTPFTELPYDAGRYVFVPWVAGAWTLVLLLERQVRVAAMPLAVMALALLPYLRLPAQPVRDWARDAECLETHRLCVVTVNPGWTGGLPGRGSE